jgi:hypothetical protein
MSNKNYSNEKNLPSSTTPQFCWTPAYDEKTDYAQKPKKTIKEKCASFHSHSIGLFPQSGYGSMCWTKARQ